MTIKIAVKSLSGKRLREIELPEEVFAYPYKEHLIHLAVQAYLAGLRAGTHKTKTRAEVRGAGKKLWRQKGTGRARIGSIRSPLWRKGGTVHGPVPRSYAKDLSAGEKKNALCSALAKKFEQQEFHVVESLELASHKAKDFAAKLDGLGIAGKTLVVDAAGNRDLALASRNNPALKAVDAMAVNVYDVVDRRHVVVSEQALGRLLEVLSR